MKPARTGRFFVLTMRKIGAFNPKIVLAFVAGAAFAAVALAVWGLAAPYARAEEGQSADNTSGPNSTYFVALNDNLKSAGTQIHDADTKAFYDKLIGGYGLDEASGNVTDDWLPDVDRIQRHALILPLQEAGRIIGDKDIADFYAKFLVDCGLAEQALR